MTAPVSTALFTSPERLRHQPWEALEGLAPALLPALEAVLGGAPAERVLDRLLRAHRPWSAEQRRAVAESVFGVGLWRRRLRAHVGEDAPAALLLTSLVHDLGGRPLPLARLLAGLPPDAPTPRLPGPRAWPEALSVPDWLARHVERELGEAEAEAFFQALVVPGPVCLRVNLGRTTREGLAARLGREGLQTEPTRASPFGLRVVSPVRPNILGLPSHREGLFEVQDEGSQLLGALVEARPGERVLDLCAGAGGKTLLLAALVGPEGRVDAWDVDRARLERLRGRAAHAGARAARILSAPPEGPYDRVLVDAPCSELGTLRRGPDLRFRLQPGDLEAPVPVQRAVLAQGAACVRPGGRLVYATCTLNRAENEAVAEAFEAAHGDFRRERRPGEGWLPEDALREGFFLTLPHRHGTDGFFAAVWTRGG
jgi:16S rRNA (cytosine967-C5)-methyltransferase